MLAARSFVAMAVALLPGLGSIPVRAEVAVTVIPPSFPIPFAAPGSNHGWSFTVDAPIQVTHLGLYDHGDDGFGIDYPVGLWRDDGLLLGSVLIAAGTLNPLFAHFRYAGFETASSLVLTPGETYVVGYFAGSFSPADGHISLNGFHTMNPLINQVGAGLFSLNQFGLMMPLTPDSNGNQRFGPNLIFNVIPGPGGLAALAPALLAGRARRRPGA